MSGKRRVVVVRGHQATPWELQPWAELGEEWDVACLLTRQNQWDIEQVAVPKVPARTSGSLLPRSRSTTALLNITNDRYINLEQHLVGADIVHAEELSFWFAAEAVRVKGKPGCNYKVVQTVWETLPLLETYRHHHGRIYRRRVLAGTDLFLAATERARNALLLEGVAPERIRVCPPGIDIQRFRKVAQTQPAPSEHTILSPGRLVWEKGHQDVLRAVAALHNGHVRLATGEPVRLRLLIAGQGPEERRLRQHAQELGIAAFVDFCHASYEDMPEVFARASCMVLASLPAALKPYHIFDRPRIFWEEQFGMVLPEAMAAGLHIVASRCGAIPEVLGPAGVTFDAGDWWGLAQALAAGPLTSPPGQRIAYPEELLAHYSTSATARRLEEAYRSIIHAT